MAKLNKIPVRVFRATVYIFVGNTKELLCYANTNDDVFPGLSDMIDADGKTDIAAVTYSNKEGISVIHIGKFPKTIEEFANLNHELLHCIFNILNRAEVEYDPNGKNETFTYLMSYLTEEAYDKKYYEEVKYEGVG